MSGLTVAAYAGAKQLDPNLLAGWGVEDDTYLGRPAVRLTYWSSSVAKLEKSEDRWRVSLNGSNPFRWAKGTSAKRLYGWDRINRDKPTVLLVEGESDCHTLWQAGWRNVLGVPGVQNVPDSIGQQLKWAEVVYAADEQDEGSPFLISALARRLPGKLRVVTARPEAKDFSELWMRMGGDRSRFAHLVNNIVEDWREPTEDERRPPKMAPPPRYRAAGDEAGGFPTGRTWGESDTDNASRFIALHTGKVRYLPAWNKWLTWDENRWQIDQNNTLVHEMAKRVAISMLAEVPDAPDPKQFAKGAARALSRAAITNMVYLARGIEGVPLGYEDLDRDPWLLGVANGVIDLKTGQLRDADPDDLMMMQAPVVYDPQSACQRWDKALAEWFSDPELQTYVHRLAGSSLIGAQLDHVFAIHFGGGANGKGTFTRAIQHALGPYAVTPHLSLLVDDKNTQHDTVKAQLFRARLAIATETERRVRLREAQIKNLTGGDRINARRLYEDPWEFDPSHHLWLVTNHLPEITGRDLGIWRRIRVVPWVSDFTTDPDRDLDASLRGEAPGILRWLVEGCLQWQTEGLAEPEAVKAATDRYRAGEDIIARWIAATGLVFDSELSVPAVELTDSWRGWCETHLGETRRFNEPAEYLAQNGCVSRTRRWRSEDRKQRQETRWLGVGYGDDTEVMTPDDPSPETLRETVSIGKVSEQGSSGVHTSEKANYDGVSDISGEGCSTPESCAAYPFRAHLPLCPGDDLEVF
ncbi:MAG: phage/plasmid primase, P4 family [Acidimicrobiia bacterium]